MGYLKGKFSDRHYFLSTWRTLRQTWNYHVSSFRTTRRSWEQANVWGSQKTEEHLNRLEGGICHNEIKSRLLTRTSEGLTVLDENGEVSVGAVQWSKNLRKVMSADYKWTVQCKAATRKAAGQLFKLRPVVSCGKPEVFVPLYKAVIRSHLE